MFDIYFSGESVLPLAIMQIDFFKFADSLQLDIIILMIWLLSNTQTLN